MGMGAACSPSLSLSSSLISLPSSSDLTKPTFLPLANRYCSAPPPLTLSTLSLHTATRCLGGTLRRRRTEIGRRLRPAAAASVDAAVPPLSAPPANTATEQIISATTDGGDGVFTTISVLLGIAFVGLSIVTIGVIYIAVTDFLQNREKDRFEKEEAEANKKRKKGGKKNRVRARAGPRGFGQKTRDVDEDED